MKESDIRRYAQLMGELGLTGLEIKNKDDVVRLERSYSAAPVPAAAPVAVLEQPAPKADADTFSVTSPMVGVFYQAPAENAEPYVKVGDKVLTAKYAGSEVKLDGENYTIVRESDILAIVE